MSADYFIALDHIQAELGDLYTEARRFRALEARADADLLPAITRAGMHLRALRRRAFAEHEIAAAAATLQQLRDHWTGQIQEVRNGSLYQEAVRAYRDDDQPNLARLLPEVFSGIERNHDLVAQLCFGVRVSVPRRRGTDPPFLTPTECVANIISRAESGFRPGDPEESAIALRPIACASDPKDLDTPVALALPSAAVGSALFFRTSDAQWLVYSQRVCGPFRAIVARSWEDDWWDVNELPYPQFRDEIVALLHSRGFPVALSDDDSAKA